MELINQQFEAVEKKRHRLVLYRREKNLCIEFKSLHGDINKLIHSPIIGAGKTEFKELQKTFYHITTKKGSVTLLL